MIGAALYRLAAELACLAGIIGATVLAYADKSPWIWGWFLLFAFANMVTGGRTKTSSTETKTETVTPAAHGSAA